MKAFLALILLLTPALICAQTGSTADLSRMAGCTLQGRTYTCSKADLKRALSLAQTIATSSQPANHASDAALASLVRDLGKTQASPRQSPDQPSDLTFILEPLQDAGVSVGPATVDLARLRVLITAPAGQEGKLLWVETYTGDPSMVWPAVARATTAALRDQIKSK